MIANSADYDPCAVLSISTAANLVRNISFTLLATSRYLKFILVSVLLSRPQMWKMRCLSSLLLAAIGFLIKPLLPGGSRLGLILSAAAMRVIDLAVNILLALNIDKRRYLFGKVRQKLE